MQYEWNGLMRNLTEIDYSVEMFEHYLKERSELLQKHGKTILDFGVNQDDTADLWKAFNLRFVRHVSEKTLEHVSAAQREILRLKTVQFDYEFENQDFGLAEVRRQLERLMKLK